MVRSSNSVVAISIIVYHGRLLHRGSVNEHKLLLAIYVQGKSISKKSCIHENFYLEFFYQFSVEKFPNNGIIPQVIGLECCHSAELLILEGVQ